MEADVPPLPRDSLTPAGGIGPKGLRAWAAGRLYLTPLRLRLMGFAILCAIPGLVFPVVLMMEQAAQARRTAMAGAASVAEGMARRLDHTLATAEAAARLMAAMDLDGEGSRARCAAKLSSVASGVHPGLLNYLAADPKGEVICSAQPFKGRVSGGDRPHFRQALASRKPALSGYVVGRVLGRGALIVLVPAVDASGVVDQVGVASIALEGLTSSLEDAAAIAPTVTVFDRAGLVVSRSPPAPGIAAGTDASGSALFRHASSGIPAAEAEGLDGRRRAYAFRSVTFHGEPALWIATGVDLETMDEMAAAERRRYLLWVAFVLLGVVTVAAFAGGPLVLARFSGVQEAARAIAAGDSSKRIPLKWRDDLRPVEEAFNGMLDAIGAERARLEESERRYRLLFEHNLDGVLLTEPNGRILAANRAACALLGRSEQELKGLGRDGVVDAADPRLAALLKERAEKGEARGELRLRRADGSFFDAEVASRAFADVGGILKTCIVVRDVTELKRTRTKLLGLNHTLEAKVEERTAAHARAVKDLEAFVYSVSHDLRAPLRTMDGFAKILDEDYSQVLPEKARHYVDRIRVAAGRLGSFIDELLEFSKMREQQMRVRQCDTRAIVDDVLAEAAAAHPGWAGEVSVQALAPVQGDPALLRQLWANLISNAFKYSARKEKPLVEIGVERLDDRNVFFVRDNGAGFDMEYSSRLFEVFHRLHTNDEFEGTGVGLAIVKGIVQRHRGRVWATAAVGEGATFYFYLGTPEA